MPKMREKGSRIGVATYRGKSIMLKNHIFVFGSNLAGRHGAGAALVARREFGAILGCGSGPMGQSYAIPTKDRHLRSLPLPEIRLHVKAFLAYARSNPELKFEVTRIGCGLAGYKDEDIAPMFITYSDNCVIPREWTPIIEQLQSEMV